MSVEFNPKAIRYRKRKRNPLKERRNTSQKRLVSFPEPNGKVGFTTADKLAKKSKKTQKKAVTTKR
jgi:hypothetical protein